VSMDDTTLGENPFQRIVAFQERLEQLHPEDQDSLREIAKELVISEKTVKTHVSNILSKLHLEDRTQLRHRQFVALQEQQHAAAGLVRQGRHVLQDGCGHISVYPD